MVISRDVVRRTLRFETPDCLAHDFPDPFGSDFADVAMCEDFPAISREIYGA